MTSSTNTHADFCIEKEKTGSCSCGVSQAGWETGGIKFDQDKVRFDLVDPYATEELAKVLTFGAKKYAEENWRKGISYKRLIAAAKRHINAIEKGEDLDPETGLRHAAHAMCCMMFLAWMQQYRPDCDDRYKVPGARPKWFPKGAKFMGFDLAECTKEAKPEAPQKSKEQTFVDHAADALSLMLGKSLPFKVSISQVGVPKTKKLKRRADVFAVGDEVMLWEQSGVWKVIRLSSLEGHYWVKACQPDAQGKRQILVIDYTKILGVLE